MRLERRYRRHHLPIDTAVKTIDTNRVDAEGTGIGENLPVAQFAELPPVSVVLLDERRSKGIYSSSVMHFVAPRIETDHRVEISHSANQTLWKPTLESLMAYINSLPNVRSLATAKPLPADPCSRVC